jgi:hypothetical protein
MRGSRRTVVAAALAFLAAGCTGIRVSTDYDPEADLGALRTYDWRERERQDESDPRLDNSLLDARVRRAVDRELAARGLTQADAGADFLVGYDVVLEKQVRFSTVGGWYRRRGWGWGWGWGRPATYARAYDQTILILDFSEPDTGRLLWRGMAAGNLVADASPEERQAQVDRTVAAILDRFPPEE